MNAIRPSLIPLLRARCCMLFLADVSEMNVKLPRWTVYQSGKHCANAIPTRMPSLGIALYVQARRILQTSSLQVYVPDRLVLFPSSDFIYLVTDRFSLRTLPWGLLNGPVLAAGQSRFVSVVARPHFPSSFSERSTRGLVLNTSSAAQRCELTHHSTSLPPVAIQRLTTARPALFRRASASVRSLAMGPSCPRTRAPH